MKNFKKVLIGVAILSQVAFSYQDVDSDSWEGKAVKQLYEKGILTPTLMEKDYYEGEKTFSRYEIASLLYNTIKYNSEQLKKDTDVQDIIILKALVAEYGNELGQLGAKDDELLKELENTENRINSKIDSKFDELKKELDRFRITGDISLEKDMYLSGNDSEDVGYDKLEAEGSLNLLAQINDSIKATFSFDPDEGLDSYEIRVKDENLELILFEDDRENKKNKLPTFKSTIGLLSGDTIDEEDAIILKSQVFGKNLTTVLTSSTEGDILATQWEGPFKYFSSKKGTDADLAIAYARIQNDDDNDEREFISFAPSFEFTLNEKTKTYFDFEYSSIDNKNSAKLNGDSLEYTLPAEDTSAFYLYDRTETIRNDGSRLMFTFGGINTGVDYDISGIGDTSKNPFRETDLVELEANKMGSVMGTDYKTKNLDTSFYYSAYGSNDPSEIKEQRYKFSTIYRPDMSKIKYGIDLLQDKTYAYNTDENDETLYKRYIIRPTLYLDDVLGEDTQNKFMYSDIDNTDTSKKSWKAYADHTKFFSKDRSLKYIMQYYDNTDESSKELETGWNFEKKNMIIGKDKKQKLADIIIGGRYSDLKNDIDNTEDERSMRIFFAQEIYYKKWTFMYGAKYQKDLERLTTTDSLEDDDKGNDIKYGFSLKYEFAKDINMKLVYGPAEIYESDDKDDFLENRTSAFDGEEYQAKFSLTAKF